MLGVIEVNITLCIYFNSLCYVKKIKLKCTHTCKSFGNHAASFLEAFSPVKLQYTYTNSLLGVPFRGSAALI